MGRALPQLPYLAPWYRLAHGRGSVVLEYGQRIVSLEGGASKRLLPALLPLLDGRRTVDEVVLVVGEAARPAVENALSALAAAGLLVDGPPVDDAPAPCARTASLLASLQPGRSPSAVAAAVAASSVAIVGEGPVGVETARLLRAAGAQVERAEKIAEGFDLVICAPSPAQLPVLSEWNDTALELRAPWLQVLPFDGRHAGVGPLYLPGETCCYECFRLRRTATSDAAAELALLARAPAAYPAAQPVDALVAGLAAQIALGRLVLDDHYSPAAFYAVELVPAVSLTLHHVHRVPRCPRCSGLADRSTPLPWFKEMPVVRR